MNNPGNHLGKTKFVKSGIQEMKIRKRYDDPCSSDKSQLRKWFSNSAESVLLQLGTIVPEAKLTVRIQG